MASPHIGQSLAGIDFSSGDPYRTPSPIRGHTFRPFGGDSIALMTGDDPRHEVNCFADEVVVDFPSVAPAIDRMRTAFLADERPSAFRAAIRLTPLEARDGVTMPVDVPV